jgi:hypothetical protein
MRRVTTGVATLALGVVMLLGGGPAFAGGAFNPPDFPGQGFTLDTSDGLIAIIVLDPNGPVPFSVSNFYAQPATPTGTFGSIEIKRPGFGTAAANFQVQPDSTLGTLRYGCNLTKTLSRFVEIAPGVPGLNMGGPIVGGVDLFPNWLPGALTTALLAQLGIDVTSPVAVPAIAGIISQSCEPFPKAKKSDSQLAFEDIIDDVKGFPTPPPYPNLSANSDGGGTWKPGFLVLKVRIGLWRQ